MSCSFIPRVLAAALALVIVSSAAPNDAHAQSTDCGDVGPNDRPECILVTTTQSGLAIGVTSTTTTGITGVVATIVVLAASQDTQKSVMLRRYYEDNELAIRRDAVLGTGATMHDIAALVGIPGRSKAAFIAALRGARAAALAAIERGDIRWLRELPAAPAA